LLSVLLLALARGAAHHQKKILQSVWPKPHSALQAACSADCQKQHQQLQLLLLLVLSLHDQLLL